MKTKIILIALSCCLFVACNKHGVITSFDPMANFPLSETVNLDFDMTNSVFEGLTLPHGDSSFVFKFTVDNKDNKKYYYKIYYQNIDYAFEDSHPLSYENFYGSWEDTKTEFKPMNGNSVVDSFRIVGNPRDEKKFYGHDFPRRYRDDDIERGFKVMRSDAEWYASIIKKAETNGIALNEQMYKDLMWNMESVRQGSGDVNRRERRNPRVGRYEFMLVVAEERALNKIPSYIKDISKKKTNEEDGTLNEFVNPFSYFLCGEGKSIEGVTVMIADKKLKTRAKYDLTKGVFINRAAYPYADFDVYADNPNVGDNDSLYRYAQFEEYYHNINTLRYIPQIQKIADVLGNGYTLEDYLKTENDKNLPIKSVHPFIAEQPGKNIRVHNGAITLINPASKSIETARKENVGIKGRVGFTYGKYIYKIKFPALLNKSGLWTGLTNAAWLIYQSNSPWNYRRHSKNGYVQESYDENESRRINDTHYSEIDIEMIKTSAFWPSQKKKQPSKKDIQKNNKFVFAATNWDLANGDIDISDGTLLFDKKYKGNTFTFNRWNKNSRNLTSRVEISNDIFDAPYYYYVIEWKPKEIIWYIGADPEHLTVVGYMSEKFTSIPNNQMLPIITQEYHYSEFWPPIIFEQGLLPYPSEDIKGVIYDLTVE